MVIAVAACDNVEWGGLDLSIVPPPPKTGPSVAEADAADRLPQGPILYHVLRDAGGLTLVPVGEILEQELRPITTGHDPDAFGERFITAFLRDGAEFTLFRHGRRAGTLAIDSAWVPTAACRRLPRAAGAAEIGGDAGDVTEFLAMARTQAPEGRMIGQDIEVASRMQVVGDILAERAIRAREAPLPNWSRARRQIQPFPVSETRNLAFTATFLVDDELTIGHDDEGYSLFIVYTPRAQTGYDTAYVDFTSYTAEGKAAPRTIDFLDWDRDGAVELLLEVFGTRNSWYAAIDRHDEGWGQAFEDRCDPVTVTAPVDTTSGQPLGSTAADRAPTPTSTPQRSTRPRSGPLGSTVPPDSGSAGDGTP